MLGDQLASLARTVRQIEPRMGAQDERLAKISESLEGMYRRLVAIQRAVFLVEAPTVPRHSRRRPLT